MIKNYTGAQGLRFTTFSLMEGHRAKWQSIAWQPNALLDLRRANRRLNGSACVNLENASCGGFAGL
jgi:hypothetical protein